MAKIGGSLVRGDGTLAVVGDGGNIVITGRECELSEIKKEYGHVSLSKDASMLQVTVC